jgi:hypothetical protein
MHISDAREVAAVLGFFRKHIDHELDVSTSIFEGLIEYQRLTVAEVDNISSRVVLLGSTDQHRLELNLHAYSMATVSPDGTRLEIDRLLGGRNILRFTASEIK